MTHVLVKMPVLLLPQLLISPRPLIGLLLQQEQIPHSLDIYQLTVGEQLEMTFTCSAFLGDIPLRQSLLGKTFLEPELQYKTVYTGLEFIHVTPSILG